MAMAKLLRSRVVVTFAARARLARRPKMPGRVVSAPWSLSPRGGSVMSLQHRLEPLRVLPRSSFAQGKCELDTASPRCSGSKPGRDRCCSHGSNSLDAPCIAHTRCLHHPLQLPSAPAPVLCPSVATIVRESSPISRSEIDTLAVASTCPRSMATYTRCS